MKRGFTLIELMIVVIIIGIMATFALPQYLKVVERAKVGKAKNTLALVVKANKMYYTENNNTYTDAMATLNNYIEMPDVAGSNVVDSDWDYTAATTGSATASRTGGGTSYTGKTITLSIDGTFTGDHPLK